MKKILKFFVLINIIMILSLSLVGCGNDGSIEDIKGKTEKSVSIDNRSYGLYDVADASGKKVHYQTNIGTLEISNGTYIFTSNGVDLSNLGLTKGNIVLTKDNEFTFQDESGNDFHATYNATSTEFEITIETDTISLYFTDWNDL